MFVVVALAAAAGVALFAPDALTRLLRGTPGGDFTLTSASGPVSLRELRGKFVLVYFGYTFCPDVCPTSLSDLSVALRGLTPAESERFRAIFVSVDPERDTPEALQRYAAAFHPSFVGVTGSPAELALVAQRYGAHYAKAEVDSAAGYLVDHTASFFVVDPDGALVGRLEHGTPPAELTARLRAYLTR